MITICTPTITKVQNNVPNYLQNASDFLINNFYVDDSSGWFSVKSDSFVAFSNFIQNHKWDFGLGADDSLGLKRMRIDSFPFTTSTNKLMHNMYQQYYKGIKVEFAEFYIHHKDSNYIKSINCKVAQGLNLSVTPVYTEAQALTATISHLGTGNIYIWQDSASESAIKIDTEDSTATNYPVGNLILAKVGDHIDYASNNFILAWQFDIITLTPVYSSYTIYIDAVNNTFIKKYSNIQQDGPAQLMYYGTQIIDTKTILTKHYLKANNGTRNIHTKLFEGFINTFGGWDNVKDADDNWDGSDILSTTPHWCVTRTWDYFRYVYNQYGCDNSCGEVRVVSNYTENPGAFYVYTPNQNNLYKKDYILVGYIGNAYLSHLDGIGHEFTHGIDKHNADLLYEGEAGALDESFAYIFGLMVEKDNGNLIWTIGETSVLLRRMNQSSASPAIGRVPQPAAYTGANWYTGPNDFGGVHTNSGVQNYWFYLLSQGSAGAPDGIVGNTPVIGIGVDKAANIAYYNLVNYISHLSSYNDASIGAINSARDIYGLCSNEHKQTRNAWAAVGIGNPVTPLTINGPTWIYYSQNGNVFGLMPKTFNATGGIIAPFYVWNYSGPWAYNVGGNTNNLFNINNFFGNYSGAIQVNSACESVSKQIGFFCLDCPVNGGDPTTAPNNTITIHPNPATTYISITANFIDPSSSDDIIVTIADASGAYVYQQSFQNSLPESIDISNFTNGTYTVIVHQGNIAQHIRFVKQ